MGGEGAGGGDLSSRDLDFLHPWFKFSSFWFPVPSTQSSSLKMASTLHVISGDKKPRFIVFGLLWITFQMFQRGYSVTWTWIPNYLCSGHGMEQLLVIQYNTGELIRQASMAKFAWQCFQ